MKKLMFAAALAAAFACQSQAVESGTVGYQNFALDTEAGRQFTMVATQFGTMDGKDQWVCTDKLFDTELVEGDGLFVFDKAAEDRVYYYFLGFDDDKPMWMKQWTDGFTGELMTDETLTSHTITRGETIYWLPSDGESGTTVAGNVANLESGVSISFPDSAPYNLVNPYPVSTKLVDLESFFIEGDNLYIFDEASEDRVYYYYLGEHMWMKQWTDGFTGELMSDEEIPNTFEIFKAGQGGVFNASDDDGRVWNVSIN